MKTITHAMLMFVLACSVAAMAQTGMSSDSSMKKSDQMGKSTTMTGCLVQKDGKYLLTNEKHPDGVQLMGSENLKPHVGHKISVTGMMGKSGNAMKSDDKMSSNTMSMGMPGFHVNSMKMISDKCSMGKMDNMSNMSH
ncbi:MAG TPA: hypothetical protein VGG46_07830 [Terriglobales bacterium]